MKTKIFLFAGLTAILFTCQNLQAQVKYGVHTGGNIETQAELGQLWNNCEIYQGFLIGGFLEYGVMKNFSLQTELNYEKKGEKVNSTVEGIKTVTRREFNYLTVPLLIKGIVPNAGLGDKWDVTLFAGPYAGILTSANSKLKSGDKTVSANIDNEAKQADFGAIFGGGVNYELSNGGAIVAELRYEMGLSEIDDLNSDLRNKGLGITIGYRF
jgi:hypothetical protein